VSAVSRGVQTHSLSLATSADTCNEASPMLLKDNKSAQEFQKWKKWH